MKNLRQLSTLDRFLKNPKTTREIETLTRGAVYKDVQVAAYILRGSSNSADIKLCKPKDMVLARLYLNKLLPEGHRVRIVQFTDEQTDIMENENTRQTITLKPNEIAFLCHNDGVTNPVHDRLSFIAALRKVEYTLPLIQIEEILRNLEQAELEELLAERDELGVSTLEQMCRPRTGEPNPYTVIESAFNNAMAASEEPSSLPDTHMINANIDSQAYVKFLGGLGVNCRWRQHDYNIGASKVNLVMCNDPASIIQFENIVNSCRHLSEVEAGRNGARR